MNVYKSKIQSDGIIEKLKLKIVVREDSQYKYLIGDTWSPTALTRNLKYFLVYDVNNKAGVHQSYFIGSFLQ